MRSVGPFELSHVLGRGAHATVWSAVHEGSGTPVAVKLLGGARSRPDLFRSEVRAVARLSHPNVVHVFDYGEVTEAEAGGDPSLVGAPWLVMELAERTLLDPPRPRDWEAVRRVLEDILAGLAHAHARDLVHRDLKPSNVLRLADGRLALGDFGVALLVDEEGGSRVAGTPAYMAPEQIRGQRRRIGPWTDLYALGCLTWELVCGEPPFQGNRSALVTAHVAAPLPPLAPRFDVPEDLADWLAALLAKDPAGRPRTAAAASHLLRRLGPAVPAAARPAARPSAPEAGSNSTWTFESEELAPGDAEPLWRDDDLPFPELGEEPAPTQARLSGAGLRLFGLRRLSLVGRSEERATLVDALRAVCGSRRAEVVLLTGATGTGKSRLARWVSEWAREHGVADAMVARVDEPGVGALLAACGLEPVPDEPASRSQARVLAALRSRPRPTVLWLDDLDRSIAVVEFLRALAALQELEPAPVLVVGTAVDERLAAAPEVARILDALPRTRRVAVGPLSPSDRLMFLSALQLADPALAGAIDQRAAGNPQVMLLLVEHAIERGQLRPGPNGFGLAPGGDLALPDDVTALWRARLSEHADERGLAALEVAATLGLEVARAPWSAACASLGLEPDLASEDRLAAAGLLEADAATVRFAHGMIREALVREAERSGRSAVLHAACAGALDAERLPGPVGAHLIAAGRPMEAIPLLSRAVMADRRSGRTLDAWAWAALWERAAEASGLGRDTLEWQRGTLERAQLRVRSGDPNAAEALIDQITAPELGELRRLVLADIAAIRGDPARAIELTEEAPSAAVDERARLGWLVVRGRCLGHVGRHEEGDPLLAEAGLAALRIDSAALHGLVSMGLADSRRYAHDREGAHRILLEAAGKLRAAGEHAGLGQVLLTLSIQAEELGDYDAAEAYARESLVRYEAVGSGTATHARWFLATLTWVRGRPEEARADLESVLRSSRAQGRVYLLANAALQLLSCAQTPEAFLGLLEEGAAALERLGGGWTGKTWEALQRAKPPDDACRIRLSEVRALHAGPED